MLRKQHIIDQNSKEWYDTRSPLITSSTFSDFFMGTSTVGYQGAISKVAFGRLGIPFESFKGNWDTEEGHELEEYGKIEYELMTLEAIEPGYFWTYGDWLGSSPDGIVKLQSLWEHKGKTKPNTIVEAYRKFNEGIVLSEKTNKKHWWQIMHQMYVTGIEKTIYQITARNFKPLIQELILTNETKLRIEHKVGEMIPIIENEMKIISSYKQ